LPCAVNETRAWADSFLDELVQLGKGNVVVQRFDPNADKAVKDKATRVGVKPLELRSQSSTSLSVDVHWQGLRFVYANGTEMVHGGHTDCTFYGTEGTIECSRGHVRAYRGEDPKAADDATLLEPPHGGEIPLPRNASHIDDFLRAIREGRDPICTAETGHRTATICQLCNIGYEIGKPLAWNPAAERFTGAHAAEANALTTRSVRRHA